MIHFGSLAVLAFNHDSLILPANDLSAAAMFANKSNSIQFDTYRLCYIVWVNSPEAAISDHQTLMSAKRLRRFFSDFFLDLP